MSRRGCSIPANASGFDPHRASISSRYAQAVAIDTSGPADYFFLKVNDGPERCMPVNGCE
jgi:hypothetical protein